MVFAWGLNKMNGNQLPLVTVVLYAYNEEKFVREAVGSALAQTYSPLEIVLSDDGSTDRTYAIMEEMAAAYRGPHKIILNRNEKNIGIGSQLNAARHKSEGQLFVLANADDISKPHRVERIVEEWNTHGRAAAAIWSPLEVIDREGRKTGQIIDEKRDFSDIPASTGKRFGGPGAASLAIRRDCFSKFGDLLENLILEDGPLNLRATLLGKWLFIDEPLVLYRVHDENISHAFRIEKYEEWLKHYHKARLWHKREGQKAYLQMLNDLYSQGAHAIPAKVTRHARAMAAQRLMEDQFLECYYSGEWQPSLTEWLRAILRMVVLVVKVSVKGTFPWIEKRNDRWHYRSAQEHFEQEVEDEKGGIRD